MIFVKCLNVTSRLLTKSKAGEGSNPTKESNVAKYGFIQYARQVK